MGIVGDRLGVAVVGYGYWGPNLVRNVIERPELHLVGVCERDEARQAEIRRRNPDVWVDSTFDAMLLDDRVDAVVIATPPRTHFELARRALDCGKHVLVEKPLATTTRDAEELIAAADAAGLVLMPGHTFLYSPPVNKVRELIDAGELGEVYFVTSSRMNLGKYQRDGVICDLVPHDLSILLHWLGGPVTHVSAGGRSVFNEGVHETAFLTFGFEGGAQANVQVSWLAPCKVRQMVVVGSKRMVLYDDTAADDSVRVYDRGLDFDETPASFGEYNLTYRAGDMIAPRIEAAEPLSLELGDFARAILTGGEPRSNAALGLEIVRSLEAADRSLARGGEPIWLAPRRPVPALLGNGNGNGHARVGV